MTPETLKYALIMLAAGVGVPVLAALNAQLGTRIGSPAAAGAVMFAIAGVVAVLVAALGGQGGSFALIPVQPKHLFLAGLLIAFYLIVDFLGRAAFRGGQCRDVRASGADHRDQRDRSFRAFRGARPPAGSDPGGGDCADGAGGRAGAAPAFVTFGPQLAKILPLGGVCGLGLINIKDRFSSPCDIRHAVFDQGVPR